MITSVDKFLVALVGAGLFALNTYTGVTVDVTQDVLNAIVIVLTPILTWAAPNKDE